MSGDGEQEESEGVSGGDSARTSATSWRTPPAPMPADGDDNEQAGSGLTVVSSPSFQETTEMLTDAALEGSPKPPRRAPAVAARGIARHHGTD